MKKACGMLFILVSLITSSLVQCAVPKIGTVNLALVVSLHPQMSLFDFDRMGFFKIPPGLSKDEFNQRLNQLKNAPASPEFDKIILDCQNGISRLDKEKRELLEKRSNQDPEDISKITSELNRVVQESEKFRNTILDIEYQRICPDLTSPKNTRKILNKIETEVMTEIKKLARDNAYSLILNASVTAPSNYPEKYSSGEMYGLGVPGIDYSLFYAFLANKDHALPGDDTPESRKLINWLELTHSPNALNMLPIRPYPLVLEGGEDLSGKIVEAIYKKHMVDTKVLKAVMSVLDIFNQHAKTYDTKIESLVSPK